MATSSTAEIPGGPTQLKQALEPAPQPILLTSVDGMILWANRAARNALGRIQGQHLADAALNRFSAIERMLALARGTSRPLHVRLEFVDSRALWHVWRIDHPDDADEPLLIFQADSREILLSRFLSLKHEAIGSAPNQSQAAETARRLRQEAANLLRMTRTDRLTGLLNAEGFEICVKRAMREGQVIGAFVFADLDRFKEINDRHGHDAGDAVLKHVGQRFATATRSRDCIARIGGDEFLFWFAGVTEAEVGSTLIRLETLARGPVAWADPVSGATIDLQVGASFGHAVSPRDGEGIELLKAVSDRRMYEAKRAKGCGR